jgi:hypothetical protein
MHSHATRTLTCPLCRSGLKRVRRSFADRLVGLFVPVLRYRCRAEACHWEALVKRHSSRVLGGFYQGRQVLEPSRGSVADERRSQAG